MVLYYAIASSIVLLYNIIYPKTESFRKRDTILSRKLCHTLAQGFKRGATTSSAADPDTGWVSVLSLRVLRQTSPRRACNAPVLRLSQHVW